MSKRVPRRAVFYAILLTIVAGVLALRHARVFKPEQSVIADRTVGTVVREVAQQRPIPGVVTANPVTSVVVNSTSSADASDATDPQPLDAGLRKHFPEAQVLVTEDSEPNEKGVATRMQLLQTSFKYPLIRVVERRTFDSSKRDYVNSDQEVMVADHVLVQKSDQMDDALFQNLIHVAGAEVLRRGSTGVYIVQFDGHDLHALDRVLDSLKKSGSGVVEAEPDFVRFAF